MNTETLLICPILSVSKQMSTLCGTNNGSVQCQEEQCAFCNPNSPYGCICTISGQPTRREDKK